MSEKSRSWPTYLAVAGAVAGLAGGFFLGGVRVANSEPPQLRAEWAGTVVFTLVYLAPYVWSLFVLRRPNPFWRAAVWGAAAVLSALAAYSAFSGVGLVMLPAAVLLAPAALTALLQSAPRQWPAALALSVALVALTAGAFLVLITGPNDGRCWELVRDAQGETAWEAAPYIRGGTVTTDVDEDEPGIVRVLCTSDVITTAEAAVSFLLLAVASLLVLWLPSRWPTPGQEQPASDSGPR